MATFNRQPVRTYDYRMHIAYNVMLNGRSERERESQLATYLVSDRTSTLLHVSAEESLHLLTSRLHYSASQSVSLRKYGEQVSIRLPPRCT